MTVSYKSDIFPVVIVVVSLHPPSTDRSYSDSNVLYHDVLVSKQVKKKSIWFSFWKQVKARQILTKLHLWELQSLKIKSVTFRTTSESIHYDRVGFGFFHLFSSAMHLMF